MKLIKDYYKLKDDVRTAFIKYYYADDIGDHIDYINDTNEGYWIGNGTVLGISDIFVNLEDIIYLLEHKIPLGTFTDWYWYSVDSYSDDEQIPHYTTNLISYIKIRGKGTHDDFISFQAEQERIRATPEHKAQVETELKNIWNDGLEKINKYIKKETAQPLSLEKET